MLQFRHKAFQGLPGLLETNYSPILYTFWQSIFLKSLYNNRGPCNSLYRYSLGLTVQVTLGLYGLLEANYRPAFLPLLAICLFKRVLL